MKNIIFAMLAMVLSAVTFAAPSSSASWTPFGGAPTFEQHTDADLTELPVGVMLTLVTVEADCGEDFFKHLNGISSSLPADQPPLVLYCAEPPANYDSCIAAARANFDAIDAYYRAQYQMAVDGAKALATGKAVDAALARDTCVAACDAGSSGDACRTQCEGIYCNSLGFAQGQMDDKVAAAQVAYNIGRGANHQQYINAQAACCDG